MNSYIECYSYNDGNLKLIGIVDDFTSFTFERSYSNIGEWQIVISNYSNNAACLKKADFIKAGKGMSGLITKISQVKNDTDDTLTVTGVELKGLTEKRIVIPKTGESHLTYKGAVEDVVNHILQWEVVSPQDSKRQIAGTIAAYEALNTTSVTPVEGGTEWTPERAGEGDATPENIRPFIGKNCAYVKREDGTIVKMVFPETIYGGTINADGTGTKTWEMLTLEGDNIQRGNWGHGTSPGSHFIGFGLLKGHAAGSGWVDGHWPDTANVLSNAFENKAASGVVCWNTTTMYLICGHFSYGQYAYFTYGTADTTMDEWYAFLEGMAAAGTPVQVVYELETPETFTATIEEDDRQSPITYEGRFSSVSEDIVAICESYEIGWYADIENGEITWHIYRGVDRKTTQSKNSRLIISYDYDSMSGSTLEQTIYNTNTALIAGQGEGVDRATTIINDDNAGLNRTEVYIDARDIEDDSLLPQRGVEKLAEYGSDYTFEITPSNSYFINNYRNGYDLGDVGTLKEEGVDFRLTSITEINENNQFSLSFVFGYDTATLEGAFKRMRGNTDALISKEA